MCRVLDVSRNGYCQCQVREPSQSAQANATLNAQVSALHVASTRSYGRHRMLRGLCNQGLRVGHERIRKSLNRQGLRPLYRKPYRVTTDSKHKKAVAANLLDRRFDRWATNRAWVSDITEIATGEGWLYLALVMDLASRRIVGWSMRNRITAELVCQALKSAYWRRKPAINLIIHSDRGSQYASHEYRRLIKAYGMKQSMSREAIFGTTLRWKASSKRSRSSESINCDAKPERRLDLISLTGLKASTVGSVCILRSSTNRQLKRNEALKPRRLVYLESRLGLRASRNRQA